MNKTRTVLMLGALLTSGLSLQAMQDAKQKNEQKIVWIVRHPFLACGALVTLLYLETRVLEIILKPQQENIAPQEICTFKAFAGTPQAHEVTVVGNSVICEGYRSNADFTEIVKPQENEAEKKWFDADESNSTESID